MSNDKFWLYKCSDNIDRYGLPTVQGGTIQEKSAPSGLWISRNWEFMNSCFQSLRQRLSLSESHLWSRWTSLTFNSSAPIFLNTLLWSTKTVHWNCKIRHSKKLYIDSCSFRILYVFFCYFAITSAWICQFWISLLYDVHIS